MSHGSVLTPSWQQQQADEAHLQQPVKRLYSRLPLSTKSGLLGRGSLSSLWRQVAIPTGRVHGGPGGGTNHRQVKTKARRYFSSVFFQLLDVWVKWSAAKEGEQETNSRTLTGRFELMTQIYSCWRDFF